MPTLTERIAVVIDANATKAVSEFKKLGKASQDELEATGKSGSIASKVIGKLGIDTELAGKLMASGLAVGSAAAIKFGQFAVNAASDLGEQQSATNVIFEDGAGIVTKYAQSTARSIGISQRAALEAANSFGDLFLNVGFSEKQAGHLSVAMVQLAGDLASFKNLGTAEVLQKLQSGLVGETEPLRSLGIVINEATVKSKAMELGLGGAHRELTDGEKIAARYALIIEKTKNAQGDAARTSDSLANKTRQLNAQTEDAAAKLGQNLTPAVGVFAAKAGNALSVIDQLAGAGSGAGGGIAAFTKGMVDSAPGIGIVSQAIDFFGSRTKASATTTSLLAQAERDLGLASGTLAEFTKDEGKAHELAAKAAEEHAKAVDKMNEAALAGIGAELGYERSLNSLEDAQTGVKDAQTALTDAVAAHGPKSAEAAAAAEALSRAQLGLKGDLLGVADAAATVARDQAIANGATFNAVDSAVAQIGALDKLRDQFPGLNAQIDAYIAKLNQIPGVKETVIRQRFGIPAGRPVPETTPNGMNLVYADGGIVRGPQVALIGEAGPEVVLPLSPSKAARRNTLMRQAGLGWASGGIAGWSGRAATSGPLIGQLVVHASGYAEGRLAGQAVVDALLEYQRANSAVPIRVTG